MIIISLSKTFYNFKSFFHKNNSIILEVTFLFFFLILSCIFILFYEFVFDLVNFIFVVFQKLHSGDLLCEILGLNENEKNFKVEEFRLPFRYRNFYRHYELLYKHTYWMNIVFHYKLAGVQKEIYGVFPSYSNSIRTMQSDQNTIVWGNDEEELQDLSLNKNWIAFRPSEFYRSPLGKTAYVIQPNRHRWPNLPPMQLTLAPRIAFIYPTFPINPFIREEILSRNPNYSDTEPGYLFWPRVRSFNNRTVFYDLSRIRWTDKINAGVSHRRVGSVNFNKVEKNMAPALRKRPKTVDCLMYSSEWEPIHLSKGDLAHNFPILAPKQFKLANQNWLYFPHYKHLISNGNMAVKYIYWKNKKFFPKNWNSTDSFWFNTYIDSAENKVFTQNFPYIKGTNWRRDVHYPKRYSALELYKFYALDEDMFSFMHNYYKEVIRPFNLSSAHFTYVQRNQAWQHIYFSKLNFDKMLLVPFKDKMYDSVKSESTEFKDIYVSNFINSNIYSNVYFIEFSKELIYDVELASVITQTYQDISIQIRPQHYSTHYKFFNIADLFHKHFTRYWTRRYKFYHFRDYRRRLDFRRHYVFKTLFTNYNKGLNYKLTLYNYDRISRRTTTTHIMYPRSRGNLIFFAIRDFIFGIPKEKLYYEIDPSILGISGLIELSLTLKKLKKAIKSNKDYYYLIDSHFDEYQLKWMFLYNDLINKKLQSLNDEDFFNYFRKRRRRIRASLKHTRWRNIWHATNRFTREIYYKATSLSFGNTEKFKRRKYLKFSRWRNLVRTPTLHLLRKKARVRKTWLTIYPYDYSSNNLFAFLENPAKQKDRQAFIRAINAYYCSLKAFIRGCWKIKMGRIVFLGHTGDLKFFYNRTRLIEGNKKNFFKLELYAARMASTQHLKKDNFFERAHYFKHITDYNIKGPIVYESNIFLRDKKNKTPDTRTGLWGTTKRYPKKKLRLWKFYRDLSLIINSRRDLAFYGLGVQHLFTRISRDLFVVNMPKYRDFYFNEYAFRFMTIKESKRQLIVDYLNNFTDEEIDKIWPEFDIEIINRRFTLENINFFFSFLRKLLFNRVYSYLNTKWYNSIHYMAFRILASRFDFEDSDRRKFNKIWLQYKEIFIDTLFTSKLYNMKWNSTMHTQKEIVEYQLSKHIENLENHFLQVLFDKDFKNLKLFDPFPINLVSCFKKQYAEDFCTTRVHFLSDPRILFLDMSKYNFYQYLDYFKIHLLKYEKNSRDYKKIFRVIGCVNKDYVQLNFRKTLYHNSSKFGKKDYLLNGFTIFRKIYKTFYEVLHQIKANDD